LERKTFREGLPSKLYHELLAKPKGSYSVIDEQGNPVAAIISEEEVLFDYELPKDAFRIPFMKRFVTVQVEANQLPEFSWQTFALVEKAATPVESAPIVSEGGRKLANAHLEAVITENGSLAITDKVTQKTY